MPSRVHHAATSSLVELCHSIIEPLRDAVLVLDISTFRILDANKQAIELYEYPYEELLGRNVADLARDISDTPDRLLSSQGHEEVEKIHFSKSGKEIQVLSSFSPVDYCGQKAVLNVNRDIRERKQMEAATQARERRFRAVIENNSDIMAIVDKEGLIQFVSPQVERALGFASSELIHHNVFEFIHPEDRNRAHAEYATTLQQQGEAAPSVIRFREATGSWIPFEIVASNQLHDPDVAGVIFTARDLRFRRELQEAIKRANADLDKRVEERTIELAQFNAAMRIENQERLYAERRLRESLSLLQATLEATADGILVVSKDRKISIYNRKFLEMWRIPSSAVEKFNEGEILRSAAAELQDPRAFLENVRDLYAKPDAESSDMLRFKDGRVFERYSQPQRTEDGEIVGRVWSFRDLTQTLRTEEELHQSQKMEAIGQLAGGVAHDFNNLLMLISGHTAQLLDQADLPNTSRIHCEEIVLAAKRASSLTRQLLAFSRKQPLTRKVVDLNQIITEMERMLKSLLSAESQVVIQVSATPLTVYADPSQIELMVLNLAINARDAMPDGGVLSIRTGDELIMPTEMESGCAASEFAVLEVSDTGYGMSSEVQSHIFEPFFTTKEVGKGTGLGLSAVYGIVQQAGGHITVQSEPNRGSTFRLYLPKTEAKEEKVRASREPARLLTGSETILLVEDENGIRAMTKVYLEGLGYKVLEAEEGLEAIRIADQYPGTIDLLISDIAMPRMKGGAVAEELQKRRKGIGVLFISGYADGKHVDSGFPIMEKPFTFPALGQQVRSILDGAKSGKDHTGDRKVA